MINKKIILLAVTLILTLMLSGTVSAANSNDTYAIGKNVTNQALKDTGLGLNKSSENLVITTAGSAKLNKKTTEKSLSGIIDRTSSLSKGQKITYGNGNLVQINNPNGALKYVFISKSSTGILKAKKFVVTAKGSSYTITSSKTVIISPNITQSQWDTAKQQLGSDLFSIVSIANAWANDAPIDLLAQAESNGRISYGTIGGYAATKAFIKQYPTNSASKDYISIVNPGGYDDDAFTYLVPWNYRYITSNGSNLLENVYIQWNSTGVKKGTLVLFKFNESLFDLYKSQTGTTVANGTLSEIQFNNWLLGILKNNPGQLLNIEKTAVINQTDLDYLIGTDTVPGKGLSEEGKNYILNLANATTQFTVTTGTVLSDDSKYADYVTLGKQIAQHAKEVLSVLPHAYGNISVATAPVYATASGVYIRGFYDGFASVVGTDPNNIISLLNPYTFDSYLNDLLSAIFYMNGKNSTGGDTLYAIQAQYNPLTGTLTWSNPVDLLPAVESGTPGAIEGVNSTVGKDQNNVNYFNTGMGAMPIAVMGYIWSKNVSYDVKKAWNNVAHCMWGVQDLALVQSILQQYPLGSNEHYIVIGATPNADNVYFSRYWAALNYLLDVSPGTGTSYTNNGNWDGYAPTEGTVLITWDDATNTGIVRIIDFNVYDDDFTDDPNWYTNLQNDPVALAKYLSNRAHTLKETKIDQKGLKELLASGNAIQFIQNYVYVEPTTPTKPTTPTNSSNSQQNGTSNSKSTDGTEQSTGTSGVSVSAADTTSSSVGENSGQTEEGQQFNSGHNGKATEISEANPSSSSGGSDTSFWIIIGAAILAVLVGLGFFKGTILGFIKK